MGKRGMRCLRQKFRGSKLPKKAYGRELWDRLGEFVQEDDGLAEYACGPWTIDKLFFICNYLAQVTTMMVGHSAFRSVNYIDLFAGCGVCAIRGNATKRRYPGSAVLAAGCRKPFDNLFLVEKDEQRYADLLNRVERLGTTSHVHSWLGDANVLASEIAGAIPPRSLNVAFVDPYSLDVDFETVTLIAGQRPLDLMILFADDIDLIRNVERYYYPQEPSKLDRFLGAESGWRKKWDELEVRDAARVRQLFADIYLERLRRLGYRHSRMLPIPRDSRPLYRLIYASKHELGVKCWDIAVSEDLGGSKNLWTID